MNMNELSYYGRRFVILVIGALVLLTGYGEGRELSSSTKKTATSRSEPRGHDIEAGRIEKKIHDLINLERKKKGLSALVWNERLNRIARTYSRDMVERKFFSHNDPEGRSFIDRYREGGFECKLRNGNEICLGAENIAQDNTYRSVTYVSGNPSYDWNSEDAIAVSVVKRWMQSRGHRENILTPYFKCQGIGIAISDDGKVFVTQNFC
ncbi:MAG TPA: CAP domain-containing protein [Thermodesulfovibrionales bacterium]|nr:CAP domain-containing protein [Thermodesulfovibrionales bacterium]